MKANGKNNKVENLHEALCWWASHRQICFAIPNSQMEKRNQQASDGTITMLTQAKDASSLEWLSTMMMEHGLLKWKILFTQQDRGFHSTHTNHFGKFDFNLIA